MESQQLQDNILCVSHDKEIKSEVESKFSKKDQEKKSVVHYLKLTKIAIQRLSCYQYLYWLEAPHIFHIK